MRSVLLPATVAALRGVRAHEPTFGNMIGAEIFEQKMTRGRFRVLKTSAGEFAVYDPTRPFGDRTVESFRTENEAAVAVQWFSDEATRREEPNERERHGWKLDWGKAESWQPIV
jgi:hypothetical protein